MFCKRNTNSYLASTLLLGSGKEVESIRNLAVEQVGKGSVGIGMAADGSS
jgi:hypothetical protein